MSIIDPLRTIAFKTVLPKTRAGMRQQRNNSGALEMLETAFAPNPDRTVLAGQKPVRKSLHSGAERYVIVQFGQIEWA